MAYTHGTELDQIGKEKVKVHSYYTQSVRSVLTVEVSCSHLVILQVV